MSRTFEKFHRLGNQRLEPLRGLSFEQLRSLKSPPEDIRIGWWKGAIATVIEEVDSDTLRVVVHGALAFPIIRNYYVYIEGFRKHRDGSTAELTEQDIYNFD